MGFKKYMSVSRPHKIQNRHLDSFMHGDIYAFPKLDGANAQVWLKEDGTLGYGSRNNDLSLEMEGFNGLRDFISGHSKALLEVLNYFTERYNKEITIYGEWMVPHTVRHYEEAIWKKFWIFDIMFEDELEQKNYIEYYEYDAALSLAGYPYVIPLLKRFPKGITGQEMNDMPNHNFFMTEDGIVGEGVVFKCYDLVNRPWLKIISEVFSEKKQAKPERIKVPHEGPEIAIVEYFLDRGTVNKEKDKLLFEDPIMEKRHFIPRLFQEVFVAFVDDNMHGILKKYKYPKIDFRELKKACDNWVREEYKELF